MHGDEARTLLGFPPKSRPTLRQVKSAYRRKVWESHPDLFPAQEKPRAEYKFKLVVHSRILKKGHLDILGSHNRLQLQRKSSVSKSKILCKIPDFVSAKADFGMGLAIGTRAESDPGAREGSDSVTNARVVRTGVPRAQGGRGNPAIIGVPFLFIILGTIGLGGLNAARAYRKQKEEYPSHNPFLP